MNPTDIKKKQDHKRGHVYGSLDMKVQKQAEHIYGDRSLNTSYPLGVVTGMGPKGASRVLVMFCIS